MQADIINIGLAFLEGFALIISPCILPILPIILSGSLTGSKARPLGIVIGFIIFFAIFTLFSRSLLSHAAINMNTIRNISFGILILLGIIMLSNTLTEKLNFLMQRLTNTGNQFSYANNPQGGFFSGFLFGGLVGIIWTPCAGPILAAVIVQVVLQQTSWQAAGIVIAFAIGAALPMLLIALLGRNILSHFSFFRERSGFFRKLLGLIIIISVIYFLFFQSMSMAVTPKKHTSIKTKALINGLEQPYTAPAFAGIDTWINSPPLTWQDLRGKVVLVDFWTYSCINCLRTLPYIKDWYAKYHDKGFEIVGVHSPEFQFEHDVNNVKAAVIKNGITYPVALDNEFQTWLNFHNEYWPAHYLVNKEGKVVYVHFGEGEYEVTENNIRFLLGLNASTEKKSAEENDSLNMTPETYLGFTRAERFVSPSGMIKDKLALYQYPAELAEDEWALSGTWLITGEKIVSLSADAAIKLHFRGKKVYMVMGVTDKPIKVKLQLDGKPLINGQGKDVNDSSMEVNEHRLYSVVNLIDKNEGTLEAIALQPGLEIYTFTFGN